MYHQCKLVHADLSEYNILYHENHLWIIDVSQSVEHDHPSAFDFLRKDLNNVDEFFSRLGVKCLGLRRTFDFVIRESLDGEEGEMLTRWLSEPEPEAHGIEADSNAQQQQEESVFMQSFIPRNLYEVYDPERDIALVNKGDGANLIYADTIGLVNKPDQSVHFADNVEGETEPPESSGSADEDKGDGSSDSEAEGEGYEDRKPRGHRHEDKEEKKVENSDRPLSLLTILTYFSGD